MWVLVWCSVSPSLLPPSLLHPPPFGISLFPFTSQLSLSENSRCEKVCGICVFFILFPPLLACGSFVFFLTPGELKRSARRGPRHHRGSGRKVWSQPCRLWSDRTSCFSGPVLWVRPTLPSLQQLKGCFFSGGKLQLDFCFISLSSFLPNILCIEPSSPSLSPSTCAHPRLPRWR